MDTPQLQNIKKMYEKLTYFDQYGGSVVLFVIITIIVFIIISYCFIMINSQPIINDWPNQRCNPNIIPFAGFLTHPEGVSATEYTAQNFTYCVQNNLLGVTDNSIKPLNFAVKMFQSITENMKDDIQNIRAMFNKFRTMNQDVTQNIMKKI